MIDTVWRLDFIKRVVKSELNIPDEAQRASSGGPTLPDYHTFPFVHRIYMNGRLRRQLRPPFATLPLATLPLATLPLATLPLFSGPLRQRPATVRIHQGSAHLLSPIHQAALGCQTCAWLCRESRRLLRGLGHSDGQKAWVTKMCLAKSLDARREPYHGERRFHVTSISSRVILFQGAPKEYFSLQLT